MKKKILPPDGMFYLYGIDPGGSVFGVSEYSLEYHVGEGGATTSTAVLEDYYSVHMKASLDQNGKIQYLNKFFGEFPFNGAFQRIAYIEEVPFVQNRKIVGILHEYVGVIKGVLLNKGYAVHTIPTSTWKSQTVGNGRAKKVDLMKWATGGNLPVDPATLEEDSLDALLIGYCGLKRLTAQLGYDLAEQAERLKINAAMY